MGRLLWEGWVKKSVGVKLFRIHKLSPKKPSLLLLPTTNSRLCVLVLVASLSLALKVHFNLKLLNSNVGLEARPPTQ